MVQVLVKVTVFALLLTLQRYTLGHGWVMQSSFFKQSPITSSTLQSHSPDQISALQNDGNYLQDRRTFGFLLTSSVFVTTNAIGPFVRVANAAEKQIDINNAVAREFTAFPGLFPTIATKIVKGQPYDSKNEVYAVLNEQEQERLRLYDSSLIIAPTDKSLQQFKGSQICKYECKGRVSNSYRDEQIKAVQQGRMGMD